MRGKKGLTLVELIVSVVFTAVIIAAAASALYYAAHTFQSGSVNAQEQQRAALAESFFQRYGATAYGVSASPDQTKSGVFFTVENNTLKIVSQTAADGAVTKAAAASVDGVSSVEIEQEDRTLHYRIHLQEGGYVLSGGVVMNNAPSGDTRLTIQNGGSLFLQQAA